MKIRKITAIILSMMMIAGSIHALAFADEAEPEDFDKAIETDAGEETSEEQAEPAENEDTEEIETPEEYTEQLPPAASTVFNIESGSCGKDATFTLDTNGKLTVTGTGAIKRAWKRNVVNAEICEGITSMDDDIFELDKSLETVTLPSTLTSIPGSAFYGCTFLKSVTIAPDSSMKKIEAYAFYNTPSLTSIDIPEGVTELEFDAFRCSGIKSVTLPSTLTTIGDSAFEECYGLLSISIPDSVTSLGEDCFRNCASCTSLKLSRNANSNYASFRSLTSLKELIIPEGVTYIGAYSFSNCTALKTIRIPSTVTCIDKAAFEDDKAVTDVYCFIEDPAALTWHLTSSHFGPSTVIHVKSDDFKTRFPSIAGMFRNDYCGETCSWYFDPATKTLKISGSGAMTDFTTDHPEWETYKNEITSIEIAAGITHIGNFAFDDLEYVTTVTIAEGSALRSIGKKAFDRCLSLENINLPEGLETIGEEAFKVCIALPEITIPSTVTSIGEAAFWGCEEMTDVYNHADPDLLTWPDDKEVYHRDFKQDGTTVCHVSSTSLDSFLENFGTVNVIFTGDL